MSRPLYLNAGPARFDAHSHNAGLWYDKFVNTWNGNWNRPDIEKLDWIKTVCGSVGCESQLREHSERQRRLAEKLNGQALTLITATRFATGLGREHPIEIGFAWHHTLGTPYLTGSSVKGLLRAYVREWVSDQVADEVFGPAGNDNDRCVGKWIFFDAIPTGPAQLEADVMTPHYGPYYRGEAAPGDWHSPVPIPFLAVAREQSFQFAFAPRNLSNTGRLPGGKVITNDTIADWLRSALHWLGAGAKTNTGYGVFREAGHVPSEKPPATRLKFEATLELVTPAFLAGADQQDPTDCTLRPATLRGQLRWWWRTLHAGFLSVDQLRELEGKLWGNTNRAGAIRVVVDPIGSTNPQPYVKTDHANMPPDKKTSDYGIPGADPRKTTQGLSYVSFGMDEKHVRRFYLDAATKWNMRIVAREGGNSFTSKQALAQAKAALWLLCQFGAIGSKARKGFGSLEINDLKEWTLDACQTDAAEFRRQNNLPNEFVEQLVQSPALGNVLMSTTAPFRWSEIWGVLDQIGFAYQAFTQGKKHDASKRSLGLPRKIHGPRDDGPIRTRDGRAIQDPEKWQRPEWLDFPKRDPKTAKPNARHASPIHIHVSGKPGDYTVRATAFPARYLPDLATSREFLTEFLKAFGDDLNRRAALPAPQGQGSNQPRSPAPNQQPSRPPATNIPQITSDQLKQRLTVLSESHILLKVERPAPSAGYHAQWIKPAPKTTNGYQPEGGWILLDSPSLNEGAIVVAERVVGSKSGKFVEAYGRLPQAPRTPPKHKR